MDIVVLPFCCGAAERLTFSHDAIVGCRLGLMLGGWPGLVGFCEVGSWLKAKVRY